MFFSYTKSVTGTANALAYWIAGGSPAFEPNMRSRHHASDCARGTLVRLPLCSEPAHDGEKRCCAASRVLRYYDESGPAWDVSSPLARYAAGMKMMHRD